MSSNNDNNIKSNSQILNIISIIVVVGGIISYFALFRMFGIFITSIGLVIGIISFTKKQKNSKWVLLLGIISWIVEFSIWAYDVIVNSA
ncbi:MAG: hypothetical protein ACTSRK_15535 [Promethearchaeota archaeon]